MSFDEQNPVMQSIEANVAAAAGQSLRDRIERIEKMQKEWALPPEWNPSKRWNPFNSYKLLVHVERWRSIQRGKVLPAPVLVTVDPCSCCNLNCEWCNTRAERREHRGKLTSKAMQHLADYFPKWGAATNSDYVGVKAVCITGGGEPLLNPATGEFIDRLVSNGIEVGVITNGSMIDKHLDSLAEAAWVGVSMDAASRRTFNELKRLPIDSGVFDKTIENIAVLSEHAKMKDSPLSCDCSANGISLKYLLYKENISEMFSATKLAKEIGCKSIHFRPAATPWDKIGTEEEFAFNREDILLFEEQMKKTLELDDETFSVFGVGHKFSSQFSRTNHFSKCYAMFMTSVIEPPSGDDYADDSFTFSLCSDRRGDAKLELNTNLEDVHQIEHLWGSDEHWELHDEVCVEQECPRCSFQAHNEIFEKVIIEDSTSSNFI